MKFWRWWWPVIVWMFLIFILSSQESVLVSDKKLVNFLFFKTLHVLEYALLYVLYYRALKNSLFSEKVVNMYAVAFFLTTLYALTDEIHQSFVPTREGKLRDVIIDAIGGGLSWSLIEWLPKAPPRLRRLAKILRVL